MTTIKIVISCNENIQIITHALHSWKYWCFHYTRWQYLRYSQLKSKYPLYIINTPQPLGNTIAGTQSKTVLTKQLCCTQTKLLRLCRKMTIHKLYNLLKYSEKSFLFRRGLPYSKANRKSQNYVSVGRKSTTLSLILLFTTTPLLQIV